MKMNKAPHAKAGLLVSTDLPTIAFGLYHIAKTLQKHDIPCYIHSFKDLAELFEMIDQKQIDLIGFSVHWHSQLIPSLKLSEHIKCVYPDKTIVLGGLTASHFAADLISFSSVDFVIVGDGELPFLQIAQGFNPSIIPNLLWKTNDGIIQTNPVTYEVDIETLRDFVYDTQDDFKGARRILKMGKGCFYDCFHCGGRLSAFNNRDACRPIAFKAEDITHVVLNNYSHLKFKHLYLAQDHHRDIKNIAAGLTALPESVSSQFSINIAAWGLPDLEAVKAVCRRFPRVCLEVTFDSLNEAILKDSRRYPFSGPCIADTISAMLETLFALSNLEINLFFSYPHLHHGKMLFPDLATLQALFHFADRFRREHLEERFGLYYFLLSTDPGSQYGQPYSFSDYWSHLLHSQGGLGSFCFHHRPFMDDQEFMTHHLFLQVLMKIFERLTLLVQYLYHVTFHADINCFYNTLFDIFGALFQEEIADELAVVQSYAGGHSYLGYSCIEQEAVNEPQLSNFTFRFLRACFKKKLIDDKFSYIQYLFHSKSRLSTAAYRSCLVTATETGFPPESSHNNVRPVLNPFVNICQKVPSINLRLSAQLAAAGTPYRHRRTETMALLLETFSLAELYTGAKAWHRAPHMPGSNLDMRSIVTQMTGAPPENDGSNVDSVFEFFYKLSKGYHPKYHEHFDVIVALLVKANAEPERVAMYDAIKAGNFNLARTADKVNYVATDNSQRLIPLTDEEVRLLERCDGLSSITHLKISWMAQTGLNEEVFGTVMRFLYSQGLLV